MMRSIFEQIQMPPPGSRVLVAMSGGVDSSLVARLVHESGCTVIGASMLVQDASLDWPSGLGQGCYGPAKVPDTEQCRRLCAELGAEYHVVDLSQPFQEKVLQYFTDEYTSGRTPNPCVHCNPQIKFSLLPAALRNLGCEFDYFATGHYVRVLQNTHSGAYHLAPAADSKKDQSYFLQRLDQDILKTAIFPLGSLTKDEVRQMARQRGLESADKKESQDFASTADYPVLFGPRGGKQGLLCLRDGKRLGTHKGLEYYTIGQRRGLGVSIGPEPLYVTHLDATSNTVFVGPESDLYAQSLFATNAIWSPEYGKSEFEAWVKVRLASTPVRARVMPEGDCMVRVEFSTPQRAVTPGQSVAFYVDIQEAGQHSGIAPLSASALPPPSGRVPQGSVLVGGAVIQEAL